MTTVLRSADYDEAVESLAANPVVIAMAAEVPDDAEAECFHETGSPRFDFMKGALDEFHRRAPGVDAHHIGGVAEAIAKIKGWGDQR